LVCDDLVNISSHRAILSSYSKMFRDIFDFDNIDSNVVLFLHGVQSDMLKSIMQYIYVGEIQLKNDNVDEFLKVAEYLQIDEVILESIRTRNKSGYQKPIVPIKKLEESNDDFGNTNIFPISNLEIDLQIKKTEDYQECSECDEILENSTEYKNHLKTVHEDPTMKFKKKSFKGERTFMCDKCERSFTTKHSLKTHDKIMHQKITYSCDQCSFIAKAKSQLRGHIKAIHEGEKKKCTFCEYSTSYNQALKNHVNKVHLGITYHCNKCEYIGTNEQFLREHIKIKHEGIRRSCTHCDYSTKYANTLKEHIKSVHLGKNFYCEECDYVGKDKKIP